MLHTVIFMGRSGCGKGTQAALFKDRIHALDPEKRHILYVETGDRFRNFIRGESFSSKISKELYEKDELQPDFLATNMWGEMLITELEENMHVVFDGVARSLSEAKILETALRFYKRELPTVIYIDVSKDWSEKHLLARGRSDDVSLAKIHKRLEWFETDVVPAIEYFKGNPMYKFIRLNGEQTVDEVHRELMHEYQA